MDRISKLWHNPPLKVRVAAGGRIVIPAEVRQELGVEEGDELLLSREGDAIRITTYERAIKRARELVARYVRPGESLADELARDRQQEAAEEEREPGEQAGRTKGV